MVVRGHVKNGEIVLDKAVSLPEGAAVEVSIAEKTASIMPASEIPTLMERLKGVIGTVDDLPADSSRNLDDYLYGAPKQ